jgi:sugar O-acyltransferase (sialic acid O-acetyltransferase NeuD family)
MFKRLAILGASGHGKVVADAAEASGWEDIVFFDDAWPLLKNIGPWGIVGATSELLDRLASFEGVVVGIGNNAVRREKLGLLHAKGGRVVSVIHPSAIVSPHASVGVGSVVFAGAVVNAVATVGAGAILNTNSVVEHDCILDIACHVSPGAVLAGGVKLGNNVWVGANASLRQLVRVGDNSLIGMGAVVTKDVPSEVTVIGNPAGSLSC